MSALLVLIGLLAALTAGLFAWVTLGTVAAVVVAVILLGLAFYAAATGLRVIRLGVLVISIVALFGSAGLGGYTAYGIYQALTDTDGPLDRPDPVALASARAKLDAIDAAAGFRIELFADELTALFLDELAGNDDSPLRGVELTVEDGEDGGQGRLTFIATFKSGSLTTEGAVSASLEFGGIKFEIIEASVGRFKLPGLASGAVEDLIETVADLNERLRRNDANLQTLELGDGRVLIVGTQGDGELLTADALLDQLRENAAALGEAVTPPQEVYGPGTVNSRRTTGSSYYLALGDSLAAAVGVAEQRDGYVSRFHNQLQIRDGESYGLRNLGVSGETSGTLILSGQLGLALDFIRDNDISYITIDIGANDLFGHLGSDDCSTDLGTPGCQQRVEDTLVSYRANLDRILGDLQAATGGRATIIFLTAYNPFSLGFGSAIALEGQTDAIAERLNAVAADVASAHGVLVADGLAAMSGTAAVTTHMLEARPDIHPRAIGYDLLTGALVDALP